MPLFPLRLVVFPQQLQPLHIFEQRYKLLVADVRQRGEEGRFGIVLAQGESTAAVGCAVALERVLRTYPDGRLDILVRGREVIAVRRLEAQHPFPTAQVEVLPDTPEPVEERHRAAALALLLRLREVRGSAPPGVEGAGEATAYRLADAAHLSPAQRQRLLEVRSENGRLALLVQLLRQALTEALNAAERRRRIRGNGRLRPWPGP